MTPGQRVFLAALERQDQTADIARLQAENARLRAALESIQTQALRAKSPAFEGIVQIADKALAGGEGGGEAPKTEPKTPEWQGGYPFV